jgi:hypothetical protein
MHENSSTKKQIPDPDRVNAYNIYYRYRRLETDDALNLSSRALRGVGSTSRRPGRAQTNTNDQNSEQIE